MTTTEIKVGRRSQDGIVELSVFVPQLLTMRVTHGGEAAAAVQLTREQVAELRRVLAEFEAAMEQEQQQQAQEESWNGNERRSRPAA